MSGKDMAKATAVANMRVSRALVASLAAHGVRHFIISPGSRSGPLAVAVAALTGVRAHVMLDERSAAFFALGIAKGGGGPAALICTSGSAPAHYFPAILEAAYSCLPLIILSADRPPELRHCHAGQTIDQAHLFGTHVRMFAELPVPGSDWSADQGLQLRQLREICRRCVSSALGPLAGPVHINVPLREPLLCGELEGPQSGEALAPADRLRTALELRSAVTIELPSRTLILTGALPAMMEVKAIEVLARLSRSAGLPVLADGASPLRHRAGQLPLLVHQYDRIVREGLDAGLLPEAVLCIGEMPLSKVMRKALQGLDIPGWQVGPGKPGMNPVFGKIDYHGSVLHDFRVVAPDLSFGAAWADANAAAEAKLQAEMAQPHALFEGDIFRSLPDWLEPETVLMVANSLAIRDAEWFLPATNLRLRVFSQRGVNGIDGTVSISRGIATALATPVVLVTGDLAFLHDSNGLLGSAAAPNGLFVILINNSGGGIFELLPAAKEAAFEELFATPQCVDFSHLVAAHGGQWSLADGVAGIAAAWNQWERKGLRVVECRIDRKESAALHRRFLQP